MSTMFDFNKLKSTDPKVKYGFAKKLLETGAEHPALIYKHFDFFVSLLDEKNNILKWTGIDLIGYLSAVDNANKIDKQIKRLVKLLHCGQLITCNHAIFALGLIAENKKEHKKKIFKELLLVENDNFETVECRNIAIGKVIEVFKQFIPDVIYSEEAIAFINRATENSRNATKKKAIQLTNMILKIK